MGLVERIIERNKQRINNLSKNHLETEFDLKFSHVKNICSKEELELIKDKYQEMVELETKIGRVNETKPPFSGDVRKLINLKLFFNNLKYLPNPNHQKIMENFNSMLEKESVIKTEKGRRKEDGFTR